MPPSVIFQHGSLPIRARFRFENRKKFLRFHLPLLASLPRVPTAFLNQSLKKWFGKQKQGNICNANASGGFNSTSPNCKFFTLAVYANHYLVTSTHLKGVYENIIISCHLAEKPACKKYSLNIFQAGL